MMSKSAITIVEQCRDFKSMRITAEDGLIRVHFMQPERGNPIDADFCREFFLFSAIASAPCVRAILFTAEGNAFSFGGDIGAFVSSLDELPALVSQWTGYLNSGIMRLQRGNAPMICAIHGACAGGMVGLMAACDLVIASSEARFVAAYPRIGFSCDAGSSVTLPRRMGLARARRFLIMNETLDAQAALDAGLIDELTAPDELSRRAEQIANMLANGPTLAFGEVRRLLLSAQNQSAEAQLEAEAQALSRVARSNDAREGVVAFKHGRRASFSGS